MPSPPDQTNQSVLVSTTLDQSGESHVTRLHRAVIGPVAANYYLPVLARLDTRERAIPIWNWAACFCTLNWMVFRGLWGPALLYASVVLGAAMGLLALTTLAAAMPESLQWSLWAALITLALLVPGFFGNAWMYGVYRKRLARALTGTASVQEACLLLNRQSSSHPRLVWIMLANAVLAALVLAAWMALPTRPTAPRRDGDVASTTQPSAVAASAGAAASPAQAESTVASGTEAMPQSTTPAQSNMPIASASPEKASEARVVAAPAPEAIAQAAPVPAPAAAVAAASTAPTIPELRRSTRFRAVAPEPLAPSAARAAMPAVPAKSPGQFLINVGLFAQDDNARRAHARLREAGLPAIKQELQGHSGKLTRVRVGPFATRADADAATEQIRALQLDAVVVRQ